MTPDKSQRRLGRGLDALFNTSQRAETPDGEPPLGSLRDIPLESIKSNPFQPRADFDSENLKELSDSLNANGLLQPVTVRTAPDGSGFELIAGERRYRAAGLLGWKTISAVVKDLGDQEMLTLALVENLQRSDLNPIEEAEGYDRLIRDFGYTQQTVGEMVGKNRSTVSNMLRILQLPESVRGMLRKGTLTSGQARPILALESPTQMENLARIVVSRGWSARQVEEKVREIANPSPPTAPKGKRTPKGGEAREAKPAVLRQIEQQLRKHLQTDVTISMKNSDRGTIAIEFYSAEDLERITERCGLSNIPQ